MIAPAKQQTSSTSGFRKRPRSFHSGSKMARVGSLLGSSQVTLLLVMFLPVSIEATSCFKRKTQNIPADHMFNKKAKPLILGHRGQPRLFQENTIEGIKSLADLGADGFETDIYLTDHGQLVLFHDDNAKALTGVDKNIWEMTPSEISNLTYKKTLVYGKKTYKFSQNLKVALLEDLLNAVKDSELFMYLELKPSKVVYANKTRSVDSGREVAKLVTKLGLEKQVFIVSFDFLKSLSAKLENPNIVVGSFYKEQYWQQDSVWYSSLKRQLKESFPGLGTCLDGLPNDRSLMDFLFEKGSIFKSMNASFVDMQFTVYNNKKFSNNTFKTLRDNYNDKISCGAWTVYSMKLSSAETDATEKQVQLLIDNGAERLITDDVPKLRKKLCRSSANAQAESLMLVLSLSAIALRSFNLVL